MTIVFLLLVLWECEFPIVIAWITLLPITILHWVHHILLLPSTFGSGLAFRRGLRWDFSCLTIWLDEAVLCNCGQGPRDSALAYHRLTGLWSWLLLGKERCGSFGVTAIYNRCVTVCRKCMESVGFQHHNIFCSRTRFPFVLRD